jgi:hypothetical protein
MQALERDILSNNWMTLLFVFCLLLIFLLKLFKATKLKGYGTSIFNKGFIEIEIQEKNTKFSFFHITFTLFSFLSVSITTFLLLDNYKENLSFGLVEYVQLSSYILIYVLARFIIEFLITGLLEMRGILAYFFLSKRSYLYSISIGLFALNTIYYYGFQKFELLLYGTILLFTIRLTLILNNNKNLIIKELFYFILYLCAFEIAPLFVLFKLIF